MFFFKQISNNFSCLILYSLMSKSRKQPIGKKNLIKQLTSNKNRKSLAVKKTTKQRGGVCHLSIPRPTNGNQVQPVSPETLAGGLMPGNWEGPPPARTPPSRPGPPGPGAYKPGLAGIPVMKPGQSAGQPMDILQDLVNRGTFNRDSYPSMVQSTMGSAGCGCSGKQVGGSGKKKISKLKRSTKNKMKRRPKS